MGVRPEAGPGFIEGFEAKCPAEVASLRANIDEKLPDKKRNNI